MQCSIHLLQPSLVFEKEIIVMQWRGVLSELGESVIN